MNAPIISSLACAVVEVVFEAGELEFPVLSAGCWSSGSVVVSPEYSLTMAFKKEVEESKLIDNDGVVAPVML